MPASMLQAPKIPVLLTLCAALLPWAACAQGSAVDPFPILVQDLDARADARSTWVPVFMLGDGEGDGLRLDADAGNMPGSVLLGIAQVRRDHLSGIDSNTLAPSLRWQVDEELRLGAAMTVTEFIPCRSLMQTPLAPLQADACESFVPNAAVGVEGTVSFGAASLSLGYSESPAIWVLPGATGLVEPIGLGPRAAAVPMAPLGALAQESARTYSVGGELELNARSRVGVQLALSQLPHLENSPDIGRVQFSLAYGDFSADMATRMIRQGMESVSPWWGGMDLGVSWRTPWSGIISLGARNLVTTGEPPELGNSQRAEVSESDAFSRTPYVRYEQDF